MLFVTAKSAEEAQALWSALADRFAACKLVLHPEEDKNRLLQGCDRRGDFPNQSFEFSRFQFPSEENDMARYLPAHGFMPAAARRHSRPSAGQSGDGTLHSAVTSPCRTWPTCTIRTLGAGSTYYGPILSSAVGSTPAAYRWLPSAGRAESTSACANDPKAHEIGCSGRRADQTYFAHWRFVNVGRAETSEAVVNREVHATV